MRFHFQLFSPAGADDGQYVQHTRVGGDLTQIGSARDVHQGDVIQRPIRTPLSNAAHTDAPPGMTGLPRPPAAVFVGRADALAAIERAFETGTGVIAQVAVYGLGGIGKSELALQYAERHRTRYRLIWWIEADNSSQIQIGLADLGRAIAAGGHSVAAVQATVEEAAAWTLAWLCACRKPHPCSSSGIEVLMENSARPVSSAYVQGIDLFRIGDRNRDGTQWNLSGSNIRFGYETWAYSLINPAPAEILIRAVQAACRYSWRAPRSLSRRRISRPTICSGSSIGIGTGRSGAVC
ncbi:ATP-binding protein [Streptosporangiaceae bacterium NEAU-GS5]|nr:ATP-binding protein [Streptosporangiaceae bacterium NEAU-GS5]